MEPSGLNIDITNYKDTALFTTGYGNALVPAQYQVRPLWTTKYTPKVVDPSEYWSFMSIPMIAYYAEKSVPEMKYEALYI